MATDDVWKELDRLLGELSAAVSVATSADDCKSVGMRSREFIISLAQAVYDPVRHVSSDNCTPSTTDSKRMLDAYLEVELLGHAHEEARKFAKAAVQLADAVTHKRTAKPRDAAIAAAAAESIYRVVAAIHGGTVGFQHSHWEGVQAGQRYFAWDGPSLHSLQEWPPVPAPQEAIVGAREAGLVASFGTRDNLYRYFSQGSKQVFETDRRSWRRALLHEGQDQVLLVRPLRPGESL